jgi:hypothetical protein
MVSNTETCVPGFWSTLRPRPRKASWTRRGSPGTRWNTSGPRTRTYSQTGKETSPTERCTSTLCFGDRGVAQQLIAVNRWLHLYPTWNQDPVVLWTVEQVSQKGCGIGRETLRIQVLSYLIILALAVDEIHWDDRLDPCNHTHEMPTRFTFQLDTAPLLTNEPVGKVSSMTFQPKYKANVFKVQVPCFVIWCRDHGIVRRLGSRLRAKFVYTQGCTGLSRPTIISGNGQQTNTSWKIGSWAWRTESTKVRVDICILTTTLLCR